MTNYLAFEKYFQEKSLILNFKLITDCKMPWNEKSNRNVNIIYSTLENNVIVSSIIKITQ